MRAVAGRRAEAAVRPELELIWILRLVDGRASNVRVEPVRVRMLTSFGLDARGDLYAVTLTGTVYRFVR